MLSNGIQNIPGEFLPSGISYYQVLKKFFFYCGNILMLGENVCCSKSPSMGGCCRNSHSRGAKMMEV